MRCRSWDGYPRPQLRPRFTPCVLPLRRAGLPAAALLQRLFHRSTQTLAESCEPAAEGTRRGVGKAGEPLSRPVRATHHPTLR